jgi:hypothetical protein
VTVTTVRPATGSGGNVGGWRDQGGSSDVAPDISDDSDSTWIRGTKFYPISGYQGYVGFANLGVVAATERIKALRLRTRVGKSGGAGTADEYASFGVLHSSTGKRSDMKGIRFTSTTPSTVVHGWWTKAPHGVEWTKAIVDGQLFLLFHAHVNYGGVANGLKLYELYVDVDIHARTSITDVTTAGTTTTAYPDILWDFVTNADEDPQRSFQARVFTLAQVNASGFSPDQQGYVWDSGAIRSSTEQVQVGTVGAIGQLNPFFAGLVNGVTYVAYVRAASDFNGTDWWGAWVASSQFTMAYIDPPVPTLTVTPETAIPSLRCKLVVDTHLNLLTADDSSHELTVGSWAALANTTVTRSNTQALDGAWSMRLQATGAGDMSAVTLGGPFVYPVTPGQQYTYGASSRAGSTARNTRVKLMWTDALGNTISTEVGASKINSNTGWLSDKPTVTGIAPNGAHGVRPVDEVLACAAGELHYWDKGFLHTGASTVWTPGGMQKSDTWGFATRIDKTLIEYLDFNQPTSDTRNLINPNLATGGEAYQDWHGWARRSEKDIVDFDRASGKQHQGEGCIRWIVGEATNSVLDIGTAQGTYSSFTEVPTATIPGVPGRQYTLSQFMAAIAGSHQVSFAVQPIDSTGAAVGSAIVATAVAVGTTMVPLAVTYTVPAGAAGVRGEVRNVNGDLTTYYLDAMQLEEGAARTEWRPSTQMITNWRPVRGALSGLVANARDGFATVYDREIPPGVIRVYRAWGEMSVTDAEPVRSAFTAYVPVQIDPPGVYLIKDPQQPLWDLAPFAVGLISTRIDEDLTEFHPARPNAIEPYGKRPVIVSEWISGKNGQMTISVRDERDWFKLQALLFTRRPLLVQLPSGGQRWVRLTSRNWPEPRIPFTYWKAVVDVQEMDRPVVVS